MKNRTSSTVNFFKSVSICVDLWLFAVFKPKPGLQPGESG
jgi:hypothetical protein